MQSTPTFLGLVFAVCATSTYLWLALAEHERHAVGRRARALRAGHNPYRLEEEELEQPFHQRVLAPMARRLFALAARLTPADLRARVEARLARAGSEADAATFLTTKLLLALSAGGGYILLTLLAGPGRWPSATAGTLVLAGMGFVLPDLRLARLAAARRRAIQRALPDVLDLLSVSVEAGLGFDAAIQKVAEKFKEPVAGEFRAYLKEVRLGKTRTDGLRALADRVDLPEVKTFTAAIIQAEQLGIRLARVLRVQSDQMRLRRKQKAEELAMKLPVKLVFPLVFFIFPTVFLVVLGPLLLQFLSGAGPR